MTAAKIDLRSSGHEFKGIFLHAAPVFDQPNGDVKDEGLAGFEGVLLEMSEAVRSS